MLDGELTAPTARVWAVGALCRAVGDALQARFNPVSVRGEIASFSRAASGHCYFTLKDESGQLRCAMFRRAATQLDFNLRDGELVEVWGRLGVYEQRGDLQLVVERVTRAGQGALFEQFMKLKLKLEGEGLFDAARKRPIPAMPGKIGLVTSLGAAALHDVVTALERRVPHIPVVLSPATVQGAQAPASLCAALEQLYTLARPVDTHTVPLDVILLVRGGGAMEDLMAFNDETLARVMARSPVPIISGVGHETDFTIADFVADLRAPTPTAAAELVADAREVRLRALSLLRERLQDAAVRRLDAHSQRLDGWQSLLGRPSAQMARQQARLAESARRLRFAGLGALTRHHRDLSSLQVALPAGFATGLGVAQQRLDRAALRLNMLDPQRVLARGYAWVSNRAGQAVTQASDVQIDDALRVHLSQGQLDVRVTASAKGPDKKKGR